MRQVGFDRQKYLVEQGRYIMERVNRYDKLYLEFGGKLIGDLHAMRVLPGFDANAKIKLLHQLKDQAEIIICVYADDIEKSKIRSDYGTTYDREVLRMIDDFRAWELEVNSVVFTRYSGEFMVDTFRTKLERRGIQVYIHHATDGYPFDVDTIVSERGYGRNPYIETSKPLVVVAAPGPSSGKLATCLSQLYHEFMRGRKAGYSKFETFPIWNLPLKHPINIAYESATADLKDVNMIDPFHLETHGTSSVNYNRDIEAFPLLRRILTKISGDEIPFDSPTEMGVNRAGFCITDDEVVCAAANQEIIRRFFAASCDYKKGLTTVETFQRTKLLMEELQLKDEDRPVVLKAREYAKALQERRLTEIPDLDLERMDPLAVAALELSDGRLITGRGSELMTATAAGLLNALKVLGGINDRLHLLSPVILEPMQKLKQEVLKLNDCALDTTEVLMALSISAATNTMADLALQQLKELKSCQAHVTVMLSHSEKEAYRRLGIDTSTDPVFATNNLYYDT